MRKVIFYILLGSVAAVLSCTEDSIQPSAEEQENQPGTGIAFEASVVTSKMATRSDGSIINRLEIEFPSPGTKYYEYAGEGLAPVEKTVDYGIGIYGVYTGQYTWHDLQALAATDFADRTSLSATFPELAALKDERERTFSVTKNNILNEYYTANFFYNQKAAIGAPVGTKVDKVSRANPLTYTPERFWSNNKIGTDNYERATFWAYYPWNAAGNPGEYGVHIVNSDNGVTTGGGMGKVQYTMHPDAAQQSDFMLSELVADCSKDTYPLVESTAPGDAGFTPKRVPFKFHHMLAQVRLYAFIRGIDRVNYLSSGVDGEGNPIYVTATADDVDKERKITDERGNKRTVVEGEPLPDDTDWATGYAASNIKTVRWARTDTWDISHTIQRADISYSMSFNNIHTSAIFSPTITYSAGTYTTKATYTTQGTLGSATVQHYIMNPYWFRFDEDGQRVMLNENYMFDYFEDTPAAKGEKSAEGSVSTGRGYDGFDWSVRGANCLGYDISTDEDNKTESWEYYDSRVGKHYNYPPGNIILAVPQVMDDNDVPNITITATGYQANADGTKSGTKLTAKVTINMLQMNLKWESGFIYCYAFLDELRPGDDIVRGPETITVIFDPTRITDQW